MTKQHTNEELCESSVPYLLCDFICGELIRWHQTAKNCTQYCESFTFAIVSSARSDTNHVLDLPPHPDDSRRWSNRASTHDREDRRKTPSRFRAVWCRGNPRWKERTRVRGPPGVAWSNLARCRSEKTNVQRCVRKRLRNRPASKLRWYGENSICGAALSGEAPRPGMYF